MSGETVINLSDDQRTIFTENKTTITHLKRMGFTLVKQNEYGAWFDLTGVTIELMIAKKRGNGFRTTTI